MKLFMSISRSFAVIALTSFLLVSCSKEELVEPCAEHNTVAPKGRTFNGTESNAGQGNSISGQSVVNPKGGTGTDISDDGDDLSDSERSRVKPRN